MKKNKKKLLLILLLNAALSSHVNSAEIISSKSDLNFTDKNFRLKQNKQIEKILKTKKKELRDLYAQGDYIVKPEYLEWQVFFSSTYVHKEKGDNTLKNAEYNSDPEKKNGKLYLNLQPPKKIEIGIYVPEIIVTLDPIFLDLLDPPATIINSLDVIPVVDPVVTHDVTAGNYIEGQPSISFSQTLRNYYNPFSTVLNTTVKTDGITELIGPANVEGSYYINYNVNNSFNLTNSDNGKIDSFSQGLIFQDGVLSLLSWDNTVVNTTYTPSTGNPAFYSGGSRVINTYAGSNTISNDTIIELKGPFSFGMVAEGGNNQLVNNNTINDNAENDQANSWYNTQIPHTQEKVIYTILGRSTPVVLEVTEHPNNNVLTINGRPVFRHGGVLQPTVTEKLGNQIINGENYSLTSETYTYLGGYTGYKIGMSIIGNNVADGTTLINGGTINFNGYSSIGMYISNGTSTSLSNVQMLNDTGSTISILSGNYANYANFGMKLDGIVTNTLPQKVLINNGTIKVNNGAAIAVVGSAGEGFIENTGEITVNAGTGVYLNPDQSSTNVEDAVNTGSIFITNSEGMTAVGGRINMTRVINDGTITVGNSSVALTATGQNSEAVNKTAGNLIFNSGVTNAVGFYALNEGNVINNNPSLTGNADHLTMFAIMENSTGTNNVGNIALSGTNSVGIYNKGSFTSNGDILVSGTNSVAVYSNSTANTNINSNNISATGANGAVFFTTDGGKINISPETTGSQINVTASGNGTYLFYDSSFSTSNLPNNPFIVNGDLVATVNNGAIAFDYKNDSSGNILNFIKNYLLQINTGTVNINISETAFRAKNSTLSIEQISKISDGLGLTDGTVTLSGSDTFYAENSVINIDQDSNLDSPTDAYGKNQSHIANSDVNLYSGKKIMGTQNEQYGIGQENTGSNYTDLKLNNSGEIILTGNNTTGIYGNFTEINNSGEIKVGNLGTGIFASNSSVVTNTGDIEFKNGGIGIYGLNLYRTNAPTQDKIDINMSSGTITANGISEGYGIYANNFLSTADSTVNFTGGLIDMGNLTAYDQQKAIAVTTKFSTLNSSGNINVAENGIAIYAIDGITNITGGIINLNKDNSLGIVLHNVNATNFLGTGAVFNIDGEGIILMHLQNSLGITDTFTTNITPSSKYRYADLKNSSFIFDKTAVLESNINFIVGQNSAVLLDSNSNISSTGTNNIGVYMRGAASQDTLNSISAASEITNNGTINLGNNSVGIYADSNVGVQNNLGTLIAVGDNSQAIYANEAKQVTNNGMLNIGANSIGIFLNNVVLSGVLNRSSGSIESTSKDAVGIYSYQQSTDLINNGLINLSGDSSIGIYDKGTANRTIINNGIITVGDSSDPKNPSVGIYSSTPNVNIVHTAGSILTSGADSIGIYGNNGNININGTINVGNSGTGIYGNSNAHIVINQNAVINVGASEATAVYASDSSVVDNYSENINYSGDSYAFILNSNSILNNYANNIALSNGQILAYTNSGKINNFSNIKASGSDNIILFGINNSTILNAAVINTESTQGSNIGIYTKNSTVYNNGSILTGDSIIYDVSTPLINEYSIGIYGEGSNIFNGIGSYISVGADSVGLYNKEGSIFSRGVITSQKKGAFGIFIENGKAENAGLIELFGNNSIGMAGKTNSTLINRGTIIIHGDNSIGIFADKNSTVINQGSIKVLGDQSEGIRLQDDSKLINTGLIEIGDNALNSIEIGNSVSSDIPEIENAGIIKVAQKFEVPENLIISIKVKPDSMRVPTPEEIVSDNYAPEDIDGKFLISNAVQFIAPSFDITNPLVITQDFTQYSNEKIYKLEDTFMTTAPGTSLKAEDINVTSKSITWAAIPTTNVKGNIDIWMVKIPYDVFTGGLWYEDFGKALDEKYTTSSKNGNQIFDNIDLIDNERDLRHLMGSLAGNIYSNITQREDDISQIFENSLSLLQDSKNNTKENVKINIITTKGTTKDGTDGTVDYDYTSYGVLALREVERTYRHTFGYSLGYLHTGFEFDDRNNSEEWVDTIQLGIHNKYEVNNWTLKNDLTGRASIHNVDRNLDWTQINSRSEMNGSYETYSITSDNKFGRGFEIGKNSMITPYGGLRIIYVTRPTFEESGFEKLEVKGNDAWSVKPRVGVELKTEIPLGKTSSWKAKSTLNLAYEYELAGLNEREKAKLVAIEDGYHNLSKPEDQDGSFKTRLSIGLEAKERYGIYVIGDYVIGSDEQEDYRVGVTLKATF